MAIHEIRVTHIEGDPLGQDVKQEMERTLGITCIEDVQTAKVYRIQGVSDDEAALLAKKLLADPVSERFTVDEAVGFDTPHVVEVAYRPGVMNPRAASIMKAANDLGISPEGADASHEYAFFGSQLRPDQVTLAVGRLLLNERIEQIVTKKPASLTSEGSVGPITTVPIRGASKAKLMELSKDKLFLNPEEMAVIQNHFRKLNRDPTDAELEIIAASWSEHCGHPTFKAKVLVRQEDGSHVEKPPLMTRITTAAKAQPNFNKLVVSAFDDNSGVMRFYDGQAICGKVETHNSPSAIEPYGGAMTGSGGVFRDIMGTGQGAKTIISTDMFCFAPPDLNEDMLPVGTLHPDYLQRRVIKGVRDYGNRMGIPTANGSIHYHEDFRAKPTVIVGAYGILPEAMAQKGEPQPGDLVVIIGGRTGRDGINGATFSSGEMTDRTATVNSGAVQIGNAIEEKRMFDALLEARDEGFIRAITDCGAAGFSSAVGEMGENIGVTVDISKAPLKYPGLAPWEIWLSESQERMVAAISPDNIDEFLKVCTKYNVESTVIGEFDGSHTLTVNYGDQNVAELDYSFLRKGLPQRTMYAKWEAPVVPEVKPETPKNGAEWTDRFKAVLAHGNVCSKEPVVRQYDHGVQGGNVVAPFGGMDQSGPNDALVIRPILDKPYGVVQSHGMNPILNRLDPYQGTVWAIAEAAANYVSVGGNIDEAAAVGNYIWPFPDEEAMGSLDRSVDAAVDMMHTLGLPVISGKDSLSSTYRGDGQVIKIPPVYAMSIFGRIPDVEKTMTSDIKKAGSTLVLMGQQSKGMAGSAYYDVTGGDSGELPRVDTEKLPKVLNKVHQLIQGGKVLSCHDVSEGGLATTVAEMCFGGTVGAHIWIPPEERDTQEEFLFNETAGTFILEVEQGVDLKEMFKDVPYRVIGSTEESKQIYVDQSFNGGSEPVFMANLDDLKTAWQKPMKEIFHG
ncbi:MAG TPA: phosphoribosylformylglycinamidine synthase subunit PurL [Candidatus Saccharimonadales bacterium]|nr:phosphoribosylformylglycinamidine synthase subunit PurL [Candidatus Saccharimonadales bacterium]